MIGRDLHNQKGRVTGVLQNSMISLMNIFCGATLTISDKDYQITWHDFKGGGSSKCFSQTLDIYTLESLLPLNTSCVLSS